MSLAYNTDFSKMPGLAHGSTTNSDNPFEPFFGPTSVQDNQNVKADDVFSHETYNLPKAYQGKNLHLGDIMDFLITRTDDWYTARVMPWRMTDQLSVQWNVFRFNKTMADLEPHQGVPRYVTAETEQRADRLVRRGLAFIIEHGFFTTEMGRKHYMMNLEQITSAVHETCFFGVLHALLAGKNHYKEWQRQYGRRVQRVGDLLSIERNRWAVCQKTERGLYMLDAEMKDAMKYENVRPNTWIFPSKMSIYVSMVPSTEVSYQEVGRSSAVADNNSISKAPQKLLTFRGCTVHETRPFDMDFSGSPQELLRREQMIGGYGLMLPFDRPKGSGPVHGSGYTTDSRNIFIFNVEADRFEKIHIEDAIDNCFRFDKGSEAPANVHPAHASILYDIALPSTKEVSKGNDPLFCHNRNTDLDKKCDAVCKHLGDLPLNHFKEQDIRDWAQTVIDAYRHRECEDDCPNADTILTFYQDIIGNDNINSVLLNTITAGNLPALTSSTGDLSSSSASLSSRSGITADPDIVSELEHAWDPVLAAALHNDVYPVNVSVRSSAALQTRYASEFPQTWQNLVTADDMAFARKQVVKDTRGLSGGPLKTYLSKVNDKYAEHLTERVLSNRSSFQNGGTLDLAFAEMKNPSNSKRRNKAQKRVSDFVAKFENTAEFFKRENPDLTDNTHVMGEILRDFIQPLCAADALTMEESIEAAIMKDETVTPDMLKELRSKLANVTQKQNMKNIADKLEQASVDLSDVDSGRTAPASYRPGSEGKTDFGALVAAEVRTRMGGGRSVADLTREFYERQQQAKKYGAATKTMRMLFNLFCCTYISDKVLKSFAEYNIVIPFGFILSRPFQRYDMCSAILCNAGSQLGNTYMGHNDFQLTDDIIHKVHVGHYTFYSKSIVHDEKQYQIAENVFGAGYKGGENTRFYRSKGELLDDIHAESFRASIIAMLIPYRTNGGSDAPQISNPLDVTGRLHPTLYADTDVPEGEIEDAQYPGARYYAEFLELKKLTSYASDATEHFMSPFKYLNTICFQQAQYMWSPESRSYTSRIANTGHWGNTYNGCAKVRNGENAFLKEEAQMTPLG